MENATRALTMAGGILIALMILGALFLMFNNLSTYQNSNDASTLASQIAEVNNQFEPYNKDNLTLMELKTLYNKIKSFNQKNSEAPFDSDTINSIENAFNCNGTFSYKVTDSFSSIPEKSKMKRVIKCTNIGYNSEGRINHMEFMDNTDSTILNQILEIGKRN